MRWFEVLQISVGATTVTGWVSQFRRRGATAAEQAEIRHFKRLIAALPDHELSSILSDYEFMAAVEPNPRFGLSRDACREEVCRRAECPELRSSRSHASLDISAFEAAIADLSAREAVQEIAHLPGDESARL
jgi:hypothetical protein